jgi:hypothetical protein
MDDLTARALRHIESQITISNILEELFSSFTSRYPAVRSAQLAFALQHWNSLKSSPQLREKMAQVARGELRHAGELLVELLAR